MENNNSNDIFKQAMPQHLDYYGGQKRGSSFYLAILFFILLVGSLGYTQLEIYKRNRQQELSNAFNEGRKVGEIQTMISFNDAVLSQGKVTIGPLDISNGVATTTIQFVISHPEL